MHTKAMAVGGQKGIKWTATPKGPHRKSESITLGNMLKKLNLTDNTRESKKVIYSGMVEVDGIARTDPNYGAGLMDVVSIPKIKKSYRLVPEKNGIIFKEISDKEAGIKPCRIVGKRLLPKGKVQVTFHDGTTLLMDKKVNVNDTLVLEMPKRKVKEMLPYAPGSSVVVVHGRHRGKKGTIKEVIPGSAARKSLTTIDAFQTLTDYVFVIGKDKPVIEA
jgi:small subunit ribosomal protein S4e